MKNTLSKDDYEPRGSLLVFADEDVDGLSSAAIVGRRYSLENSHFIYVNARSLDKALAAELEARQKDDLTQFDIFIVDVGINQANIEGIEKSIAAFVNIGARVLYFDSHSNTYNGKNLLLHLTRANAYVFNGKIGVAAASIVQDFLGSDESKRLRLLGALSDREIHITKKYKNEKNGLRNLQAAVAWGAYQDPSFLDKVTRRLIRHPNIDLEEDRDIIEYAIKANNHRDKLLKHVHRRGHVLQISETPRIISVTVLDRIDFGKARGTIAGRLAGEWGAAIILITLSVSSKNSYAVTIRNSYIHKLDLEVVGQLANAENSGGSKGAYRLTIPEGELITFLSKVQAWSRSVSPPWVSKMTPTYSKPAKHKSAKPKKKNSNGPKTVEKVKEQKEIKPEKHIKPRDFKEIEMGFDDEELDSLVDLSDLD
ncbi:MAG: hypothetical protein IH840_04570 [Candidatus Heimdallarchaeota archaeon]|nr:hypothetical protein [Candidatus Heimdallarchaeota archaeon]